MSITIIIIAVVAVVALYLMGLYNSLVRLKNQVKNAWGQIDVQLQRRYDLIPNLVESVKGYMSHERETLESVVNARAAAVAARDQVEAQGGPAEGSLKQLIGAESALQGSMMRLFAVAEGYPELRASANMQQLQEELATTENKVAFSRQSYNDQVMHYNTAQESFPAVLFAAAFGHKQSDLFEISDEGAREAPKVSF